MYPWNFEKVFAGLSNVYQSPHFVDWTGCIYPEGSFPRLPLPNSRFLDPGTLGDGFRAGPNEWAAFGFACQRALHMESPVSLMLEFGASQGLWCLPWSRFFAQNATWLKSRAVAFEASNSAPQSLEFWEEQVLEFKSPKHSKNGFTLTGSNWEFDWVHAAIDSKSGTLSFPDIDVRSNNGSRVLPESVFQASNGKEFISVDAYSPRDVIESLAIDEVLHLLHIDIQGVEADLLAEDDFYELVSRTQVLVLGTHTTQSEYLAFELLDKLGFRLVAASPSKYQYEDKPILIEDGEQIWLHPDAFEFGVSNGFFRNIGKGEAVANERQLVVAERDRFGLLVTGLQNSLDEIVQARQMSPMISSSDLMLTSWSWRITYPLRVVHKFAKLIRGSLIGK